MKMVKVFVLVAAAAVAFVSDAATSAGKPKVLIIMWDGCRAENALVSSGLPIHIGQDGTGNYYWNYSSRLDDIAIWKRPLSISEVKLVFDAGHKEKKLVKDLLKIDLKTGADADFIDTTEKAGIGLSTKGNK